MDDILQQAQKLENDYIRGWKEKGGKVLGYICVATPVELIEAGGILPYRIRALGSRFGLWAQAKPSWQMPIFPGSIVLFVVPALIWA